MSEQITINLSTGSGVKIGLACKLRQFSFRLQMTVVFIVIIQVYNTTVVYTSTN